MWSTSVQAQLRAMTNAELSSAIQSDTEAMAGIRQTAASRPYRARPRTRRREMRFLKATDESSQSQMPFKNTRRARLIQRAPQLWH